MLKYLLSFQLLCGLLFCQAQASIYGLWEVVSVQVGKENMTPTAKWFQLDKNGHFQAGNGGLQNQTGHFQFTEQKLFVSDSNGKKDEFGPFEVQLKNNQMYWKRLEEGHEVTVSLQKVDTQPLAPWDSIIGTWQIEQVMANGVDITTDYSKSKTIQFFFRWDRVFIQNNSPQHPDRHSGIWQIHAHRPELRLLSNFGDSYDQRWNFKFLDSSNMLWVNQKEGFKISLKKQ